MATPSAPAPRHTERSPDRRRARASARAPARRKPDTDNCRAHRRRCSRTRTRPRGRRAGARSRSAARRRRCMFDRAACSRTSASSAAASGTRTSSRSMTAALARRRRRSAAAQAQTSFPAATCPARSQRNWQGVLRKQAGRNSSHRCAHRRRCSQSRTGGARGRTGSRSRPPPAHPPAESARRSLRFFRGRAAHPVQATSAALGSAALSPSSIAASARSVIAPAPSATSATPASFALWRCEPRSQQLQFVAQPGALPRERLCPAVDFHRALIGNIAALRVLRTPVASVMPPAAPGNARRSLRHASRVVRCGSIPMRACRRARRAPARARQRSGSTGRGSLLAYCFPQNLERVADAFEPAGVHDRLIGNRS